MRLSSSCVAFSVGLICVAATGASSGNEADQKPVAYANHLKCVDLSDLTGELPLDVVRSKQILWRTEAWEHSTWPADHDDRDSVGYPTLVRNDRGRNSDGFYYLYYSHHDPNSGIACAVARSIEGPYVKLAESDRSRSDSRVLVCPGKAGNPAHYSSPCVLWSAREQTWFMYFHYYEDQWKTGGGHQRTALATCRDLSENKWTIWTDPKGAITPVLPVTAARWMNSQSSYHAIQQLSNTRWLAFLRGTGGEYSADGKWLQDPWCKLGFATSADGRHWKYSAANPVIHQDDGGGGRKGVYHPNFVGYLGKGEYLLCWCESGAPLYGRTKDFRTVVRDPRGYARWPTGDGLITAWREGDRLYLFAGKHLHVMALPVDRPNPSKS